ncbi:nucleoside recognition domain-containing protein [Bacillota bacterium LX-D]|nr:nucleoside recognition domain-containing protein [Bacillota bacterium LX-D]
MVNLIWFFLLAAGIITAGINGHIEVVTKAALDSAKDAVNIALGLVGMMALWLGLLKIAEEAGLVSFIARLVNPIMKFLFPSIPKGHPALGAIVMNLSANILGLGNASTPLGLKAMQELQKLNKNCDEASEAMCTFLGLNTSCITLIPATIIGIRAAAGSTDPTSVVGTTIFATSVGMLTAILADRLLRRAFRKKAG